MDQLQNSYVLRMLMLNNSALGVRLYRFHAPFQNCVTFFYARSNAQTIGGRGGSAWHSNYEHLSSASCSTASVKMLQIM